MEPEHLSQRASDLVGEEEGHAGTAHAVYKIGQNERVIHDHSGEGEHSKNREKVGGEIHDQVPEQSADHSEWHVQQYVDRL